MQEHFVKWFTCKMVRSKTLMFVWMPVLCSYYKIKITLYLINNRYDNITLRNLKGTSGHKIILNINNNKCFHLQSFFKFINEFIAFCLQSFTDSNFIDMRIVEPFIFFR